MVDSFHRDFRNDNHLRAASSLRMQACPPKSVHDTSLQAGIYGMVDSLVVDSCCTEVTNVKRKSCDENISLQTGQSFTRICLSDVVAA